MTISKEMGQNIIVNDIIKDVNGEEWRIKEIRGRYIFRTTLLQRFRNWLLPWKQQKGTEELSFYNVFGDEIKGDSV